MNKQKVENIKRILDFAKLEKNWNNNNADKFDPKLIEKCLLLISNIPLQPKVFPTACNSIQFEYRNENEYLEFEIFLDRITMFHIFKKEDKTIESNISKDEFIKEVKKYKTRLKKQQ